MTLTVYAMAYHQFLVGKVQQKSKRYRSGPGGPAEKLKRDRIDEIRERMT